MKKIFLLSYLILSGILHSQNWNVFNKGYRYNYKYNYSSLVSNVLFVDTVKQSGADTIYTLNRIGVECTGSCPTITAALTPSVTYVVPNMPQFLQRCIKKYSNGLVQLYDTTKIVIVPTCTLNQSWLFDSIYNKTAVCVSISTLNIFGNTDSIKTILIQNVDTLILSKSFGILLFPDPYAKNRYYRLAGIEKKASYDLISLYGEKVPNAWDFYNYDVGDQFCFEKSYTNSYNNSYCWLEKTNINSKTPTQTGYDYYINSLVKSNAFNFYVSDPCNPFFPFTTNTTSGISHFYMTLGNIPENYMYPNMIYPKGLVNNNTSANIVKFGTDNTGKFYKYCGRPCANYASPILPNNNAIVILTKDGNIDLLYASFNNGPSAIKLALSFGENFGKINDIDIYFETFSTGCLTSFTKNNNFYFGSCFDAVGIPENNPDAKNALIYPNPANNILHLKIPEGCNIEIINTFGEKIFNKNAGPDEKIDISNFMDGIYFVSLKNSNFSYKQKVIVKH